MSDRMTFNGIDMSRFFRITDIIRPIGTERSIDANDAPELGVNIQRVKRGARVHTIKFDMRAQNAVEMEKLKHDLARVLNVNKPVKVTYSDEPDKYYWGIVVEDITPENLTRWFQRSEFKLLIPDGVAHSLTYKSLTSIENAVVTDEKMVFTITNNGAEKAYPIIKIKANEDNGYVGLVNSSGSLEIGNKQRVAGYTTVTTTKPSETLLNFKDSSILTGFTRSSKNNAISYDSGVNFNSTLNTKSVWGRHHIYLSQRGGLTGSNSGSLSWDLPVDRSGGSGSLHDYIWWRQIFQLETSFRYGFMALWVTDTSGRFLYGVESIKRGHGLEAEHNFFVTDGRGGKQLMQSWEFAATPYDHQNPFNQSKGQMDIKRNDDKIQVYWWGTYPTFYVPELKGKQSAKVHVCLGALGHLPIMEHIYLDELTFRKDFVPTTKLIPNRFSIGSDIEVNCEDDKVYIDGIAKTNEIVDGSVWLSIPPGTSQLECYFSDFVRKKPTVIITFEERW